jgi:hypothetical protein
MGDTQKKLTKIYGSPLTAGSGEKMSWEMKKDV